MSLGIFHPNIMSLCIFHLQHYVSRYISSPAQTLLPPVLASLRPYYRDPYGRDRTGGQVQLMIDYQRHVPTPAAQASCKGSTKSPRLQQLRETMDEAAARRWPPCYLTDVMSPAHLTATWTHFLYYWPTCPAHLTATWTHFLYYWPDLSWLPYCHVNSFLVLLTRPVLPTLLPRELVSCITDPTCPAYLTATWTHFLYYWPDLSCPPYCHVNSFPVLLTDLSCPPYCHVNSLPTSLTWVAYLTPNVNTLPTSLTLPAYLTPNVNSLPTSPSWPALSSLFQPEVCLSLWSVLFFLPYFNLNSTCLFEGIYSSFLIATWPLCLNHWNDLPCQPSFSLTFFRTSPMWPLYLPYGNLYFLSTVTMWPSH